MKPNGGTYSAQSVYVDLSAFVKRRVLPSPSQMLTQHKLSNEASLMIIYLFCFALVYVSYKSPYFHVSQRRTLFRDFQLYYLHSSSLNYNMR